MNDIFELLDEVGTVISRNGMDAAELRMRAIARELDAYDLYPVLSGVIGDRNAPVASRSRAVEVVGRRLRTPVPVPALRRIAA